MEDLICFLLGVAVTFVTIHIHSILKTIEAIKVDIAKIVNKV
jgi:hypothetical protein